ncbi:hypothetical protein ACSBR1_036414 [Camellia fascicularis]
MRVLRERIRDVRKKERLDMCWRVENENKIENGWKYKDEYNNKHKILKSHYGMLSESIMLVFGLVSSALGLPFSLAPFAFSLFPSLFICATKVVELNK